MTASREPFAIRVATDAEVETAGEVVARAYLADDLASERYAGLLRASRQRAGEADLLVAVDEDGTVLGTITYVRAGTAMAELSRDDPDASELRMLGVDPATRGRGVAKALVLDCIARARADGAQRLLLSTRPEMVAAQQLYAGLRFTRRPDLDWTPEPDVSLMGLQLQLSDAD